MVDGINNNTRKFWCDGVPNLQQVLDFRVLPILFPPSFHRTLETTLHAYSHGRFSWRGAVKLLQHIEDGGIFLLYTLRAC